MRLIDADALKKIIEDGLRNNPHKDGLSRVFHRTEYTHFLDVICKMPTITPPPNDPLTLDELREMDGEPVWIRNHRTGDYMCRVILLSNENFIHFTDAGLCENRSYGSHWTAYRRKPEGST